MGSLLLARCLPLFFCLWFAFCSRVRRDLCAEFSNETRRDVLGERNDALRLFPPFSPGGRCKNEKFLRTFSESSRRLRPRRVLLFHIYLTVLISKLCT